MYYEFLPVSVNRFVPSGIHNHSCTVISGQSAKPQTWLSFLYVYNFNWSNGNIEWWCIVTKLIFCLMLLCQSYIITRPFLVNTSREITTKNCQGVEKNKKSTAYRFHSNICYILQINDFEIRGCNLSFPKREKTIKVSKSTIRQM